MHAEFFDQAAQILWLFEFPTELMERFNESSRSCGGQHTDDHLVCQHVAFVYSLSDA